MYTYICDQLGGFEYVYVSTITGVLRWDLRMILGSFLSLKSAGDYVSSGGYLHILVH